MHRWPSDGSIVACWQPGTVIFHSTLMFLQPLSALHCNAQAVLWPSCRQKSPSSNKTRHGGEPCSPQSADVPRVAHVELPGWAAGSAHRGKSQRGRCARPQLSPAQGAAPPALQDSLAGSPLHPLGAAEGQGLGGGWSSPGLLGTVELSWCSDVLLGRPWSHVGALEQEKSCFPYLPHISL